MDFYLRSSDMVEHSTKNRLCCLNIVQSRDFQIWPDSLLPEHSLLAEQRGHFYAWLLGTVEQSYMDFHLWSFYVRSVGWHC